MKYFPGQREPPSLRLSIFFIILCVVVYTIRWSRQSKVQSSTILKEHSLHDIQAFFNENTRNQTCKNSAQGKYLISDSRGYVCYRMNLDENNCCSISSKKMDEEGRTHNHRPRDRLQKQSAGDHDNKLLEQFDCSDCILKDGCCREFEYCVSCCLKPQNLQKHLSSYLSIPILRNDASSDSQPRKYHLDYFDYCKYVCRTSSSSVQSENSYRGFHNHCYSQKLSAIEKIPVNSDWAGFVSVKPKK